MYDLLPGKLDPRAFSFAARVGSFALSFVVLSVVLLATMATII
jgi:hypothetical protein